MAKLAVDPDLPAHHVDELARDGKAKPGSLELAVGLAVDLVEFAKDRLKVLGRDADPGILDGDVKLERFLPLDPHDAGKDMATGGEFHRVAQKVGQDLPYPPPVADKARRQEHVVIGQKRDALVLRGMLQDQHHLMQAAFKVERLGVKLQLLRLDLRIVEKVVDDGQKRLARGADRLGAKPLILGQLGLAEKLGHADDAVHGGPDLMAHIGEEGGFRPARRLGPFAGLAQLPLARDSLGDVARQADEVAEGAAPVHQAEVAAIGKVQHLGLDLLTVDPGDHAGLPVATRFRVGLRQRAFGQACDHVGVAQPARQLLPRADHRQIDPVRRDQPLLFVEKREAVADRLKRLPQPPLGDLRGGGRALKLAQRL